MTISVYNSVGQKVGDLVSNLHPAGYHNIMWNSMDRRRSQRGFPVLKCHSYSKSISILDE
ncbi:MAG TPA: hypothetical protein EYN82_06965 [Candidatus Marinimicrobia bacterium]|nr:hypothetical protein [Candidatus Neomarinimicrobiota bacterium]